VVDTESLKGYEFQHSLSQFRGRSRCYGLIIYDANGFVLGSRLDHGIDKVPSFSPAAGFSIQTASSYQKIFALGTTDQYFSTIFGKAVNTERLRTIFFRIGSFLLAIENIIGAEMNKNRSNLLTDLSQVSCGYRIDFESLKRRNLTLIDPIESRSIDDNCRFHALYSVLDLLSPSDVKIGIIERCCLLSLESLEQIGTQLSVGAYKNYLHPLSSLRKGILLATKKKAREKSLALMTLKTIFV